MSNYDQKVAATVERLRQKGARVRVKRRKLAYRKDLSAPQCRRRIPHVDVNCYDDDPQRLSQGLRDVRWLHVTQHHYFPRPEDNMKIIYRACDGEIFEHRTDATNHETELFDFWIEHLVAGRIQVNLSEIICHFNNSPDLSCEADSYYRTPWDRLKVSLREYWNILETQRSD